MQTTTFWILAETIIHTIYILQLQQPVHRLKMEILMSQSTTETTETTMDTTLTTTFWIFLAKTFMRIICKLQREQPVYRFKAKTLISRCRNETTQTTIFSIDNKNILTFKTTSYNQFFIITSTDSCTFPQKRLLQCFLFKITYMFT